jgi:hypothetical protein
MNIGVRDGILSWKHVRALGPALPLYLWAVRRVTKEDHGMGLLLGGKPMRYEDIAGELADETGRPAVRTLKRWMARLIRKGYLEVKHSVYSRMVIRVTKAKKFGDKQRELFSGAKGRPSNPGGPSSSANMRRTGTSRDDKPIAKHDPKSATSGPLKSARSGPHAYKKWPPQGRSERLRDKERRGEAPSRHAGNLLRGAQGQSEKQEQAKAPVEKEQSQKQESAKKMADEKLQQGQRQKLPPKKPLDVVSELGRRFDQTMHVPRPGIGTRDEKQKHFEDGIYRRKVAGVMVGMQRGGYPRREQLLAATAVAAANLLMNRGQELRAVEAEALHDAVWARLERAMGALEAITDWERWRNQSLGAIVRITAEEAVRLRGPDSPQGMQGLQEAMA